MSAKKPLTPDETEVYARQIQFKSRGVIGEFVIAVEEVDDLESISEIIELHLNNALRDLKQHSANRLLAATEDLPAGSLLN